MSLQIVLATGIYPPDIGGPATYVEHLAKELTAKGIDVTVVTYAMSADGEKRTAQRWQVVGVGKWGGPLLRWLRYMRALKRHAGDADVVVAFSSISVGVPMIMAHLKKPKKILRLGGDFFWERYTDCGGMLGLRAWTAQSGLHRRIMGAILRRFDHVVFSTRFQEELYEEFYSLLPRHSVIENALATTIQHPTSHISHSPFRLLFVGRFVRFKNLEHLLLAMTQLPQTSLTLVGDGPRRERLTALVTALNLRSRVQFVPPTRGADKERLFAEHDLLVLPSITEISPHIALEARGAGLPVLLTGETGLSERLTHGMLLRPLLLPRQIADAMREAIDNYDTLARNASSPHPGRSWSSLAEEWFSLAETVIPSADRRVAD
ncbi:MAG: glycosyltransferase [Candidatus Peregrinibacteria bacterium Gr01-1014_25]|nr:MAG: glycosyltransferase [Candidatus Peregrinibacteria bacterium Gr01-1014_25]